MAIWWFQDQKRFLKERRRGNVFIQLNPVGTPQVIQLVSLDETFVPTPQGDILGNLTQTPKTSVRFDADSCVTYCTLKMNGQTVVKLGTLLPGSPKRIHGNIVLEAGNKAVGSVMGLSPATGNVPEWDGEHDKKDLLLVNKNI